MSFKNKQHFKGTNPSNLIEFTITESIEKLGIKEFILKDKDFLITWSDERQICLDFHSKNSSIEQIVNKIEKRLRKDVVDNDFIDLAIRDIEDQLIKKRNEIFNLNQNNNTQNDFSDEFKSKFLEDVSTMREQFESSEHPYIEWQQEVKKKYENLKLVANRCFPDSWQLLQFCISVKSVQNIYSNNLPFIGFILYKPSSLKSTIIDSFQKYPLAVYADDITKNSFLSHYSTNNEEQLQSNDLIPKMQNKLLLTSEIAPIINANEDDLRKILGIITRLVDGKGYQSHSGTHGHRGYPPMMFTWIGAGIEIPYKMWILLSQLGFKIYFFRPTFKKKTVSDLEKIAKDDQLPEKKQQLENALLDYLKVFDAAPQTDEIVLDASGGNPKIKWDKTKDQDSAIKCISNVANLLAPLRGTVFTSHSKTRKTTKINTSDKNNNNNNNGNENAATNNNDTEFIQTEQIDYDIEPSTTEDASRAVIQLKNLALGNAISQGRNYLTEEDAKLVITVGFSTTKIYRAKILDMLLENNGELTTSQIAMGLGLSRQHVLQYMQEFDALKICTVSQVSSNEKSERKIKLNEEYTWFLTEEFKQLYKPSIDLTQDFSRGAICSNLNHQYTQMITKNVSKNYYHKACDTQNDICHTNKLISNHESNKKNNSDNYEDNICEGTEKNEIKDGETNPSTNGNKLYDYENKDSLTDPDNNNEYLDGFKIKQNNSSLKDEKYFIRVMPSHENCHTKKEDHYTNKKQIVPKNVAEDILKAIRDENGSISLGYALQLACQRSNIVQDYLRDEKLTQRDSRKVRNLLVEIIRHRNIQIVKRKPELVVKWVENEKEMIINN